MANSDFLCFFFGIPQRLKKRNASPNVQVPNCDNIGINLSYFICIKNQSRVFATLFYFNVSFRLSNMRLKKHDSRVLKSALDSMPKPSHPKKKLPFQSSPKSAQSPDSGTHGLESIVSNHLPTARTKELTNVPNALLSN
jgi:hypothetical protein